MRYSAEHKQETRAAMLRAALHVFRQRGIDAAGVDRIAHAAGLTSGSFYKHFAGKAEAVQEVVRISLERAASRVKMLQKARKRRPSAWLNDFATTYLSREHLGQTAFVCSLAAITAEIARQGKTTKDIFAEGLNDLIAAMIDEEPLASQREAEARAAAIVALLSGGAALARATSDEVQARFVAEAVRKAVLLVAAAPLPSTPPSKVPWTPAE
jgi:TetR/AcrR family transcriptional regulator, transcriptional repressor for nem operon